MTTTQTRRQPRPVQSITRGLSSRHIHFIALGSAIGTGLFYGSAGAIQAAGPSVLLVYILGGLVVYFMLRALGEMAVRSPISGSFAEYAREYLGEWAGYITGWMYAFEMVIVCIADLTAVGIYMKFWFPHSPQWMWIIVVLLIVGAVNLASSRWFGELEFAFTIIKVAAVIAMILGAAAILCFGLGDNTDTVGVDNLWNNGGFFPHGVGGMISAFILVLFAFGGTEIIGVTAGDAQDPETTIPKAVNTVPLRIFLFYVFAIFFIIAINPWETITGEESPFVQIFDSLGVSWAAVLLNIVVISAALSAINSDIFGAGRILTGMAYKGLAPRVFSLRRNTVPVTTIGAVLAVLIFGVILNYLLPESIFSIIAALATFATIFVWLMILLAHIASRRTRDSEEIKNLAFPVPLWPYGQYFAIAFIIFTFGIMAWQAEYRSALAAGVGFTVIMSLLYYCRKRKRVNNTSETINAEEMN